MTRHLCLWMVLFASGASVPAQAQSATGQPGEAAPQEPVPSESAAPPVVEAQPTTPSPAPSEADAHGETAFVPEHTAPVNLTAEPEDVQGHSCRGSSPEVYGYIRAGYEWVNQDESYDFIGRNSGFGMSNVRLGVRGDFACGFSYNVSLEGAADFGGETNTPQGDLFVRLRDAYIRWDLHDAIGIQLGQFKAPFAQEELVSVSELLFVSRAVAQEGVVVGRGFEEPSIALGRHVGLMVSPREPIGDGDFGVSYYAALLNGNGDNQVLNDNVDPAVVGRLGFHYNTFLQVGAAMLWNQRTTGTLPNLYEEEDLGFAGDVWFGGYGFEALAQVVFLRTSFDTVDTEDRKQLGFHGQLGYHLEEVLPSMPFPLTVAYRYAQLEPWSGASSGMGIDLSDRGLTYHTFGVRADYPVEDLTVRAYANYTLTVEADSRELDNDRLQLLVELVY